MKSINWKDHLVNLLVVIVGITVAFYLESWKESSANKDLEAKYLHALAEDLHQDRTYIDTLIRINEENLRVLKILSNASMGRSYPKDSLGYYIQVIQYSLSFTPQNTTYESMKFSGKVEIIRDFDFRKKLVELHEQSYRAIKELDEAVSDHIRSFVQPFSIENIVYTGQNQLSSNFLTDNRFRNLVFPYLNLVAMRLNFYREVHDEIDEVLKEMDTKTDL